MVINLREVYQLKVQLKGVRPPVWRRFLVTNTSTLEEFHHTIQIVMGWTNSHLHQFKSGSSRYGMLDPEFGMDWNDDLQDEQRFKVKDLLKSEGDTLVYEYDFGDGWKHKITLEKVLPYDKNQFLPLCIKGKRGCPPEDVGGVWGYAEFLEKWVDENHPEHEDLKEWAGDYFDPEIFDLIETNDILEEVFTSI